MSNANQQQSPVFHEGEIAIQTRLGVAERMDKFGRMVIRDHMPRQHQEFYQNLPMLFVGFADDKNQVWASVLAKETGLVTVKDDKSLTIHASPLSGDPLNRVLNGSSSARLGVLGIEPHSRRRNRMSAQLSARRDAGFELDVLQTFGNCPQYIQRGDIVSTERAPSERKTIEIKEFDASLQSLIKQSDTFYVASSTQSIDGGPADATQGADVSHRGGRPGFIRIDDNKTLTIPDFLGNNHFNTLGNFMVNHSAGLLFIDFESGDVITLTGKAKILWDDPSQAHFKGAERLWQFTLTKGYRLKAAMPFRFDFKEWSANTQMTGTWKEAESIDKQQKLADTWLTWQVKRIVDESPSIRSFYFDTGNTVPKFAPGQFISVKVLIAGKEHTRTYSVSSSPLDRFIRISVKREGRMSSFLHDSLAIGDEIAVKLPRGNFALSPASDRATVLLSAGVGITPMVSMYRYIVQEGVRTRHHRPVLMINTFRAREDQAFFDEVRQLTQDPQSNARALWLLTQPTAQDEPGVHYSAQGRLSKEILQAVLPIGRYDFYLCGPAQFMQSVYNMLMELGVDDSDIHAEAFGPASLKRQKPPTEALQSEQTKTADEAIITFSESKVEQAWSKEDGNLLAFAEGHGLEPAFGCRGGSCGTCRVKVSEGQVVHDEQASFPIEDNVALLCCATPRKTDNDMPVKVVLEM